MRHSSAEPNRGELSMRDIPRLLARVHVKFLPSNRLEIQKFIACRLLIVVRIDIYLQQMTRVVPSNTSLKQSNEAGRL